MDMLIEFVSTPILCFFASFAFAQLLKAKHKQDWTAVGVSCFAMMFPLAVLFKVIISDAAILIVHAILATAS